MLFDKEPRTHIHQLWEKYKHRVPGATPITFLNRTYIEAYYTKRINPYLHFIGNFLAHYLGHLSIDDPATEMDTIDIIQMAVLLGWQDRKIMNHLHHVCTFLIRVDQLQVAWKTYQKEELGLSYTVEFEQFEPMKESLQIVYSWQIFMNSRIKNYNRKLLIVFRIFHEQKHKGVGPRLLWGEPNDWMTGMEELLKVEDFHEITKEEPLMNVEERYGVPLDTQGVLRYYDYVVFQINTF